MFTFLFCCLSIPTKMRMSKESKRISITIIDDFLSYKGIEIKVHNVIYIIEPVPVYVFHDCLK